TIGYRSLHLDSAHDARLRNRSSLRWLPFWRAQRLDIRNDLENRFFADQALERRHDRLVPGNAFGARIDDRLPDVIFVSGHRDSSLNLHCLAKEAGERRALARASCTMAGRAAESLKKTLPQFSHGHARRSAAQPLLKIGRLQHHYPAGHS